MASLSAPLPRTLPTPTGDDSDREVAESLRSYRESYAKAKSLHEACRLMGVVVDAPLPPSPSEEEEQDNTSIGGFKARKRKGQSEDGPTRGPKVPKLKHNRSLTIRRTRTKLKKSSKKQRKTPAAISQGTKLLKSDVRDEVQE